MPRMTIDTDHERHFRRIWFDQSVRSITLTGIYNVGDEADEYVREIVITLHDGEQLELSLDSDFKERLVPVIEPDIEEEG